MLVCRIARDHFAVAAHRFKNAWLEYEWEELYPGVPAPPWPTAESLPHSIGLLEHDHEKDTRTIPWTL